MPRWLWLIHFFTGEHQLLTSAGRRPKSAMSCTGEIRAQAVLSHIKTFYPEGAFRLPTGGIHVHEAVMDTLGREIYEETGIGHGPDQVVVERFLGRATSSSMAAWEWSQSRPIISWCGCLVGGVLAPQDETESIGGWQWRPAGELNTVAEILDAVQLSSPVWADWGALSGAQPSVRGGGAAWM